MITLEEFTPADFARLISWISDDTMLTQFAGPIFQYPLTEAQLYDYINAPLRRPFCVRHQHRTVGHAEIMLSEDGVAKLCRLLIGAPEDRGRGLGEQMVRALVAICWKKYAVKAVELNAYEWNMAALRCYEKVGFVRQSPITTTCPKGGPPWRIVHMMLTR